MPFLLLQRKTVTFPCPNASILPLLILPGQIRLNRFARQQALLLRLTYNNDGYATAGVDLTPVAVHNILLSPLLQYFPHYIIPDSTTFPVSLLDMSY
jgi:hypothetical protein